MLLSMFDKVVLIYNHFINTLSIEPTLKQILPIDDDFSEKENNSNVKYILYRN